MFHEKRKAISIGVTLLFLILSSPGLTNATETYFNICLDRSLNIISPDNRMKISNIGDTVTLNKKGRLWLTGNETKEGYVEIICQNLSTEPVNVELYKNKSPWIKITTPETCNAWQENILICPVGEMTKGFFCKTTEKSVASIREGPKNVLSASINVRSANLQDEEKKKADERSYIQQRIDYYSSGIDLCGIMHNKSRKIIISWIIYSGGTVDSVKVVSQTTPEDEALSECMVEQISLWKFPEWDKNSQISYQF